MSSVSENPSLARIAEAVHKGAAEAAPEVNRRLLIAFGGAAALVGSIVLMSPEVKAPSKEPHAASVLASPAEPGR